MPHLDDRLKAVAKQIQSRVHADIGSDHGYLLKALLTAGRIDRGIAIENKQQPFNNSKATLAGLNAEARFADGLAGLDAGEADSLSICGMGGPLMAQILSAFPDRAADTVILQPNREVERVRQWGLNAGFHLVSEQTIVGPRVFEVLRFERNSEPDPAYEGIDRTAALLLGPHHLRQWMPEFVQRLRDQQRYLQQLAGRNETTQLRLDTITRVLDDQA